MLSSLILLVCLGSAASQGSTFPFSFMEVITPDLIKLAQPSPIQDFASNACDQTNLGHCLTMYYAGIGIVPPITNPNSLFNVIQNLLYTKGQRGYVQACTAESKLYQCLVKSGGNQPSLCLSVKQFVSMGSTMQHAYTYFTFRQQQTFNCGGGMTAYLQNFNCILRTTALANSTIQQCGQTFTAQSHKHPATTCTMAAPNYMSCMKAAFAHCGVSAGWLACETTRVDLNAVFPLCNLRCTVGNSQKSLDHGSEGNSDFARAMSNSLIDKLQNNRVEAEV